MNIDPSVSSSKLFYACAKVFSRKTARDDGLVHFTIGFLEGCAFPLSGKVESERWQTDVNLRKRLIVFRVFGINSTMEDNTVRFRHSRLDLDAP
ncbi:uncharacterized protein LOC113562350 isoform X2 [Ooceraea biroi]|uniref:uncharacterized protein LOC113562350 isoform X2 n=1 Tax=Ooceraea biroi TaxID=2015173 RepID=UPI000F07D5D3|nr:uncharacterized protein LOC113562350 isoform X2 [Ooceraea biroi]